MFSSITQRRIFKVVILLGLAFLLPVDFVGAQQGFYNFSIQGGNATFNLQTNAFYYYVINQSLNLQTVFLPADIELGSSALPWQTPATNGAGFFKLSAISIYSPVDTLGDGIDDVFKLDLGLNPLDPNLANSDSGFLGGGGVPLTWLQYYTLNYGRAIADGVAYGREVSVFNVGSPLAYASREVSIFNFGQAFGSYDVISREVSVYNGQSPPLVAVPQQVYSREVSVFNSGQPFGSYDAISREVSVYNNVTN